MSQNESLLKKQYSFSDDKLDKIYSAYESGKMSAEEKSAFESDFPDFIARKQAHSQDLFEASSDISGASIEGLARNAPRVESILSTLDPAKVAKIENAYLSGKMSPIEKKDYEADRKDFIANHGAGADAKVRLAVGAETDPDRRLAVVRKYHPEAVPFGSDNFTIYKDGKVQLFNPEGFDLKDIAGATPEIVGAGVGAAATIGTGGVGGVVLGATSDSLFKNATQHAIRNYLGNNDIEDIKPSTVVDNLKEIGTDTALGLAGGALGHGVSVAGSKVAGLLNKLRNPLDVETATTLKSIIDNASPEMKAELARTGLPLSVAYEGAAPFEGLISRAPLLNEGLQEARKTGGRLLTDSIENKALSKARINPSDLSSAGTGSIFERSSGIADDIVNIRNENYVNTLSGLLSSAGDKRIPLNGVYEEASNRMAKMSGAGLDTVQAELKNVKNLLPDYDFESLADPSYQAIETLAKRLRDTMSGLKGAEKHEARGLLTALEKDITSVVPEDKLLRADYADKSTALDLLKMRGGTDSVNLPADITSPQTFVTKLNKLSRGRGEAYNPKELASMLDSERTLAERLLPSSKYENTSNTAATNLYLQTLLGSAGVGGIIGGATGGRDNIGLGAGLGALGGLTAKSVLIDQLGKGLLKKQAEKAIARSANPSASLKNLATALSKDGMLSRYLATAGVVGAEN